MMIQCCEPIFFPMAVGRQILDTSYKLDLNRKTKMTCVIEKPFANMRFEIELTLIWWKIGNANFKETHPSIM